MIDDAATEIEAPRKPRIAIMGEFSAGKSTLCNILMDGDTLPRKVTATQLAPVWMTHGHGDHVRVHLDGSETPITLDGLSEVPLDDTLYIRLSLPQEMLEHCDFIDFPGISDPNMDPDVWARLLDQADAVLWLTHATQAWRQTEAAVWDIVPEKVQARSLLLITRWDKLTSDSDRNRVYRRLQRETMGLFKDILPVSLVDALNAGDDFEAWTESGAAAVIDQMVELITELNGTAVEDKVAEIAAQSAAPVENNVVEIRSVGPARPAKPAEPEVPAVVPRRVRPSASGRTARPGSSQASGF